MPIALTPEVTKQLQASIKRFTAEHLDEEVGDLKAALFLDFVNLVLFLAYLLGSALGGSDG